MNKNINLNNKIVSSYFRVDPIDEKPLNLVKINSGTYGKIYKIKNQEKKYILKKPIEDDRENQVASDIECKILSLFSAFQNHYLKRINYFNGEITRITPKVYAIYSDNLTSMKNIIMEKLDGDMFDVCRNLNLNVDDDCVNTSAVTGCKIFNHDRKPKQIRQWIDTCNLIWDGYSNNPDFMNDPVGL